MNKVSWPKISIITPNYNLGDYLERTILSVLNQQYPNLEYIIIDGGSTDQSISIIHQYKDKLAYWESSKDKGMYDALNKGFIRSTGEIMGWINSDDMLHPLSLFKIAKYFIQNHEVEWIQGYPNVFDLNDNLIFERTPQYDMYFFLMNNYLYRGEYIQQESTFWKRSLWEKAGGKLSDKYKLAGDFDLWMRFFQNATLYCVEDYLGGFRSRPEQLSGNHQAYIKEALSIVKCYRKQLPYSKRIKLYKKLIERKFYNILKISQNPVLPSYLPLPLH